MSWVSGKPWRTCDRCSQKRRDLVKEWTGLMVCPDCCDIRPYELSPPLVWPEGLPITDPRPAPPPVFSSGSDYVFFVNDAGDWIEFVNSGANEVVWGLT